MGENNMKNSRSKNVFVNLLLGLSLMLSTAGGTFLMSNAKANQKKAYADENSATLPNGITFIATDSEQTASGYVDGTYVYEETVLNYVSVNNLIYFVKDNKLYTDTTHTQETEDLKTTYTVSDGKVTIGGKDYTIYNNLSIFKSNGSLLYLNKTKGLLYGDLQQNNSYSGDYDIAWEYTYGGNTGTNSIERYTINGVIYYKVTINGTDYYTPVKSTNFKTLYTLDGTTLTEAGKATSVTLKNVYIYSRLTSSGNINQEYTDVFGTKYYIEDGKLYNDKYYEELTSAEKETNKINSSSSSTITFKETSTETKSFNIGNDSSESDFEKFTINNEIYYAYSNKLYALSEITESKIIDDAGSVSKTYSIDNNEYKEHNSAKYYKVDVYLSKDATSTVTYYLYKRTIYQFTGDVPQEITTDTIKGQNSDIKNITVGTDSITIEYQDVNSVTGEFKEIIIDGNKYYFKVKDTTKFYECDNVTYFGGTYDRMTEIDIDTVASLNDIIICKDADGKYYYAVDCGLSYKLVDNSALITYTAQYNNDTDSYPSVIYSGKTYYIYKDGSLRIRTEEEGKLISRQSDGYYSLQSQFNISSEYIYKSNSPDETLPMTQVDSGYTFEYNETTYTYTSNGEFKNGSNVVTVNDIFPTGYTIVMSKAIDTSNIYLYKNYYKVIINATTYYVKTGDTTNLYTITGDGTINNPYVATVATSTDLLFNLDSIDLTGKTVTATFKYQLYNSTLYIVKENENFADSYFSYSSTYYYHDNKLYLSRYDDKTDNVEMKDFEYSPILSGIMLNNNSYSVKTSYYNTVMIDNNYYYVYNNKLYASMAIGGDKLLTFSNEVTNSFLEYSIVEDQPYVTIFTGSAIAYSNNTFKLDDNEYIYDNTNKVFKIKANIQSATIASNGSHYVKINNAYKGVQYYIRKSTPTSAPSTRQLYINAPIVSLANSLNFTAKANSSSITITPNSGGDPVTCTTKKVLAFQNEVPCVLNAFVYGSKIYTYNNTDSAGNIGQLYEYKYVKEDDETEEPTFVNILKEVSTNYKIPNYYFKTDKTESGYFNLFDLSAGVVVYATLNAEKTGITDPTFGGKTILALDESDKDKAQAEKNYSETSNTNTVAEVTINSYSVIFNDTTPINHAISKEIESKYLNLDIEITYQSGNSFFSTSNTPEFKMPSKISFNGTSLAIENKVECTYTSGENPSYSIKGTTNTLSIDLYNNHAIAYELSGKVENKTYYTILMRYNNQYYVIYCGNIENSGTNTIVNQNDFRVYYISDAINSETGACDIATTALEAVNTSKDIALSFISSETTNNSIILHGFRDFKAVVDGDTTSIYSTEDYYAIDSYGYITYNDKKYEVSSNSLTLDGLDFNLDIKDIYFDYNLSTLIQSANPFNYIQSTQFYVINGNNEVFNYFKYNLFSSVQYDSDQDDTCKNADRIAYEVEIPVTGSNWDIVTSNNQKYQEGQDKLKAQTQYANGSDIILSNYIATASLTQGSATEANIQNIYIQFGESVCEDCLNNTGSHNDPTIDFGITQLRVQAFLKNEETAKYANITEAYNSEYGVRISINSPEKENVNYTGQSSSNNNFYWFNYFDLSNLTVLLNSSSSGTSNQDKAKIADATGYYTLVFTYSYMDNGTHYAGNTYVYRFYLSEDTKYIDYPTFNANMIQKVGTDDTATSIVTKNIEGSSYKYYYNFQTYDVPAYTFNASTYAINYNFKYNLDSRDYTTEFKIYNTASAEKSNITSAIQDNEYGVLSVYKNGVLDYNLVMRLDHTNNAVNYYKNNSLWGSLYISTSGEFRLSLENNNYYNSGNKDTYSNLSSYYQNGKLIKTGAKNTVLDYYAVLLLDELGDYEFKNIRLISAGADENSTTTFIQYATDTISSGAENIFDLNKYYNNIGDIKITGSELMRYGEFNGGLFTFTESPNTDTNNLPNGNGSLKVYGVKTSFNKNGTAVDFKKVDENIYSDVTPSPTIKLSNGNEIQLGNISSASDTDTTGKINVSDLVQKTINYSENNYSIPLTNLQPIYFNYMADMNYTNSWYIVFADFEITKDENGNLESLTFGSSYSMLKYTNKTSINETGAYIVKIVYNNAVNSQNEECQYFMFVIDNTAPSMSIYAHNNSTHTEKDFFISSTDISSTSRYTNKRYFSIDNVKPNYFQGDIRVTYTVLSYDGKTVLQQEANYNEGALITTREGKYKFTIYYGVNSKSYGYTYISVDKTTPTGSLYNVVSSENNGTITYALDGAYDSFVFSTTKTFVSNKTKTSGATVSAKIKSISLSAYQDYANSINNLEAITTNVQLSVNSMFDDVDLNDSPIYNFNNGSSSITNAQLIGNTGQSTIYIIKLFDSAGNESYYYYFYDASRPYVLYKDLTDESSAPKKSVENNTVQSNTSIIWSNYKAISIDETQNSNDSNLYTSFISKIKANSGLYGGIRVVETESGKYLYVPISNVIVESQNNAGADIVATTSYASSLAQNVNIYTLKYAERNTLSNSSTNWTITGDTTLTDMFSGDKTYQIDVTDALGNVLKLSIKMNSSYAQEEFYGTWDQTKVGTGLTKTQAYNLDKIDTEYLKLTDDNSTFKAKITYDYYYLSQEQYLTSNTENQDSSTPYSDIAYNLENGNLYKFDNGKYHLCDNIDEYSYNASETSYDYNTINSRNSIFIAGYPYILSQTNQAISVSDSVKNGKSYEITDTINPQNSKTAPGLYVFRRTYVYTSTGEMIKQSEIESAADDSDLSALKDDYAVKYYVFYIDRNEIIDLNYSDGIDITSSIGDLLSIKLSSDGSKIGADLLQTYKDSQNKITTSKLRVVSDFPIDKYATQDKLENNSIYSRKDSDFESTLNGIAESNVISRNQNAFKYLVSLDIQLATGSNSITLLKDNVLQNTQYFELPKDQFFSLFKNGDYTLTIKDNSSFTYREDGKEKTIGGKTYTFNFTIGYNSPEGVFQTKASDTYGTITDLETRDGNTSALATGKTVVYKNINKDYLQFSFTASSSIYDANVDPYNVVIKKDNNVVFQTVKSNQSGENYLTSFKDSKVPNGAKYSDILSITGGGSIPYTYTFKIFDRSSNKVLLGTPDDNSTYTVTLVFYGTEADYTVKNSSETNNYFRTTYQISVDTLAPENNLIKLANADDNLDDYCLENYGKTYTNLTKSEKSDLLKKYVFAVSYIDTTIDETKNFNSLTFLAEKEGYSNEDVAKMYASDNSSAQISMYKNNIISKYSTIFEKNYNDSVTLYFKSITSNLSDYTVSYLPDEEGDTRINIFNKYDSAYQKQEYSHNLTNSDSNNNTQFCFTSAIQDKALVNGYYEVFEEDEAGNLSRYLIFVHDNTRVEYGMNYEMKDNSNEINTYYAMLDDKLVYITKTITTDANDSTKKTVSWSCKDVKGNVVGVSPNTSGSGDDIKLVSIKYNEQVYDVFPLHNSANYYAEITKLATDSESETTTTNKIEKGNNGWEVDTTGLTNTENFGATVANDDYLVYQTINNVGDYKLINYPTKVTISGSAYKNETANVIGFRLFNSYDEEEILSLYKINKLMPMLNIANTRTTVNNVQFDQFIRVKMYSGVKTNTGYTYTLFKTLINDPYSLSIDEFMEYVVTYLQYTTSTTAGIYTYKLEISNRFGDAYNIIVNLPDSDLILNYATVDSMLQVTLPDASVNVKLLKFKAEKYENGKWSSVVKDAKGTYIINQNIDEPSEGLASTVYYFGEGSYRFTIADNYSRNNNDNPDYKFVGNKIDSIEYEYSSKKYIQTGNQYTTAGNLKITFDASLYQIKIGLKDCIYYTDNGTDKTLSILSYYEGTNQINMVGTFDKDNNFTQYYYEDNSNKIYVFYFNQKFYTDKEYSSEYKIEPSLTLSFKVKDIFTKNTELSGQTIYTIKPIMNTSSNKVKHNFVYFVNWATDPGNVTVRELTIDEVEPIVKTITKNGTISNLQEGVNYYQEFNITWTSAYISKGTLTIKRPSGSTSTITIDPDDNYTVHELAGYTLIISDEIGNTVSYTFNMINSSSAFCSVFVNNVELMESDFTEVISGSSDFENGKIIKYYYYASDGNTPNIVIKTDESKGIKYKVVEDDDKTTYTVYREIGSTEFVIYYFRIVGIAKDINFKPFDSYVDDQGTKTNTPSNELSFNQDTEKITLNIKSYTTGAKGNKIFATHYYNGEIVKTYSLSEYSSEDTTYPIEISSTGNHVFKFKDLVGNVYDDVTITLIRDVVFYANNQNAIDNRFYNGEVTITAPKMTDFYSTPSIVVTHNGTIYGGQDNNNINDIANYVSATNSYTFSKSGYYEITLSATGKSGYNYESNYCFTIINPNVMKMTFGFSASYNFTVEKIIRNSVDVTERYGKKDTLWISSGNDDSAGLYTITLKGYNKLMNEYELFTFNVRINSETPSIIPKDYSYGTKTTKNVVLQYNGALIYSQVGESYIEIFKDGTSQGTIDINAESLDELSTITISSPGDWRVEIYNKDGNFITSYYVNRATPLNSSARLIIILAIIVFIALVIAFIILRKHTRFR